MCNVDAIVSLVIITHSFELCIGVTVLLEGEDARCNSSILMVIHALKSGHSCSGMMIIETNTCVPLLVMREVVNTNAKLLKDLRKTVSDIIACLWEQANCKDVCK